jgi:hypothetical protein
VPSTTSLALKLKDFSIHLQSWYPDGCGVWLGLPSTFTLVSYSGYSAPRWRRYVCLKCGLPFNGLHGLMSQKIVLFSIHFVPVTQHKYISQLTLITAETFITYIHHNTSSNFITKENVSEKRHWLQIAKLIFPKSSTYWRWICAGQQRGANPL